MIPLTPEQVARLRLPEGYALRHTCDFECETWRTSLLTGRPTRQSQALAFLAYNVANGHLPPEALDAVWAIVEGTYGEVIVEEAMDEETIRGVWDHEKPTHILIQVKP